MWALAVYLIIFVAAVDSQDFPHKLCCALRGERKQQIETLSIPTIRPINGNRFHEFHQRARRTITLSHLGLTQRAAQRTVYVETRPKVTDLSRESVCRA